MKCKIPHYENCNTCAGFGVYTLPDRVGEVFAVSARDAIDGISIQNAIPCPECKSTIAGIPKEVVK
jgi:hypothetical protein